MYLSSRFTCFKITPTFFLSGYMACPSQSSRFNHPDFIRWTLACTNKIKFKNLGKINLEEFLQCKQQKKPWVFIGFKFGLHQLFGMPDFEPTGAVERFRHTLNIYYEFLRWCHIWHFLTCWQVWQMCNCEIVGYLGIFLYGLFTCLGVRKPL